MKKNSCSHKKDSMCTACCVAKGNYQWCVITQANPDDLSQMSDNIFEISKEQAKEFQVTSKRGLVYTNIDGKPHLESKVPCFYPGEMFMVHTGGYHSELFGRCRRPYKSGNQIRELKEMKGYPEEVFYKLFSAKHQKAAAKLACHISMTKGMGWILKNGKFVEERYE